MRRFIGLLMLFVILFPLLLGAGGVLVTRQVVIGVQAEYETRKANIEQRLEVVNQKVELARAQLENLQSVASTIFGSATQWAQDVANAINNFQLYIGGFQFPDIHVLGATIHLPGIPAVDLTIPGLREVRNFLQNIFDSLSQLSQALADIAGVVDVVNEIGGITAEVTGFVGSLGAIIAPYGTLIIAGVVGGFIWFAAVYLVLAYTWLVRGWAMLTGRPVTV